MKSRFSPFFLMIGLLVTACTAVPTPVPTVIQTPTLAATETPLPQPSPTPTLIPTATPVPFYLEATVWEQDPQVPVLMYHRFLPNRYTESTNTKLRLADFQWQLEQLDAAGYSLISMENWLNGNLTVPPGRRPLIFTMDDLFFADQIFLDAEGNPSPKSGLGWHWQFYQQHPDFGFSWALFFNMGDKLYANRETTDDWFINMPGWEDALSAAIIWCIEHDAAPYNHTYDHVRLDQTDNALIAWELKKNDEMLRSFIDRAGRSDLKNRLGNMIGLPYSIWPASDSGRRVLAAHLTPEGKPVTAILEADYHYRAAFMPAPYADGFDAYKIPRVAALNDAITMLVERKDEFPTAVSCALGPLDPLQVSDPAVLMAQIQQAVAESRCPAGVYAVSGLLFRAQAGTVEPISLTTP
ncbi:MAG TPA: hypothetical protein PKG95_03110 [Anaerolineaceae bacterium]|nr:hypothetical protein [Anaerolineaceae bacterium]